MLIILFLLMLLISYKECKKEDCNICIFFIFLLLSILFYISRNYLIFVLFPLLLSQCLIDFKKLELSNINSLCIFILGIFYMWNNFDVKAIITISIFYIILYVMPFSNLGFGDVKLAIALSRFLKLSQVPSFIFYTLLISLIIGIIYKIKTKESIFPMGPAIIITFILLNI